MPFEYEYKNGPQGGIHQFTESRVWARFYVAIPRNRDSAAPKPESANRENRAEAARNDPVLGTRPLLRTATLVTTRRTNPRRCHAWVAPYRTENGGSVAARGESSSSIGRGFASCTWLAIKGRCAGSYRAARAPTAPSSAAPAASTLARRRANVLLPPLPLFLRRAKKMRTVKAHAHVCLSTRPMRIAECAMPTAVGGES